jgi:phosphatidylglycerophosphate synthase
MLPLIRSVENGLFEFHRGTPRAFWASLALNLTCHGVAVLEVYLVLWLLGVKVGLVAALVFEALTKLVNVVGTVNPGNIGTYEGGNVLIARMFGLNGAIGFAVAGTRRIRALFWAAVGVICLIILSRTRGYSDSESNTSGDIGEGAASGIESQGTGQSLTAVILANNSKECGRRDFPQDRVGTLPVLLRDILSAEKAGARRIIVCVDPVAKPYLQRELRATERLPRSIEWFTAGSDTSLHQLLTQIATEPGEGYLLLATGNRTYHPTLFQRASEWSGERGALALTCEDQLVGIYLLSANCLFHVAGHGPREIRNIEELHVWLVLNDSVECEAVPNALWQRVSIPGGRIAAERKLDQWLTKPTDGIFARMNRRISVPISRQLIKLPVTPNMVSLFTLGVGFAAGLFFARGGYWNMLIGALMSVWSSILDGCDGEVARLRLLESDFGCWLETVCDYLYYLFIFAGMAIGLVRNSETKAYLAWSGLLFLGAVTSFLVTGLGRLRLANGRPEQYLKIWQAQAESRRSNPILYIGRHTEFIVRRCFLPYALLFFAVLNIARVAFILSAVGVNVVWLISLYSYRTFAVPRRSLI